MGDEPKGLYYRYERTDVTMIDPFYRRMREEAVVMDEERKGLYGKYRIEKTDGTPVDPKAMYFTMRIDTDRFARAAVRAYVEACREEEPELARDLERLLRGVG